MSDSDSSNGKPSPKKHHNNNNLFDGPQQGQENILQIENKRLRRKLKQLSSRLDVEIQRAAELKLKYKPNNASTRTTGSQNLQLQNAYKMIDRLQKTVREFESKESYQVSVRRIMDLQSIIKKKQSEAQQSKVEMKIVKKSVKDKERHVNELLENSKKMTNPAEDKEIIHRLKNKMRHLASDNDTLRKRELEKHEKLVSAERKIVQMEQQEETPIGKEESLLKQVQDYKNKYKDTMQRVERQNIYIVKLNQRLSQIPERMDRKVRVSDRRNSSGNRSLASKSLDQINDITGRKVRPGPVLLDHIPSPQFKKLKRY